MTAVPRLFLHQLILGRDLDADDKAKLYAYLRTTREVDPIIAASIQHCPEDVANCYFCNNPQNHQAYLKYIEDWYRQMGEPNEPHEASAFGATPELIRQNYPLYREHFEKLLGILTKELNQTHDQEVQQRLQERQRDIQALAQKIARSYLQTQRGSTLTPTP